MNHDRAKTLLHAYADQETGPFRRYFLGRHIAACPSCLAELEAIQAMRSALRTNLPVHRAPPALAIRIASALPREAAPPIRRAPVPPWLRRCGDGGRLAGVALTLAVTRTIPQPDPLIADVVAANVRSMMADHLTDVATSDQHTVKPWLSARLQPVAGGQGLRGRRISRWSAAAWTTLTATAPPRSCIAATSTSSTCLLSCRPTRRTRHRNRTAGMASTSFAGGWAV